jgi:hypothetical protein
MDLTDIDCEVQKWMELNGLCPKTGFSISSLESSGSATSVRFINAFLPRQMTIGADKISFGGGSQKICLQIYAEAKNNFHVTLDYSG